MKLYDKKGCYLQMLDWRHRSLLLVDAEGIGVGLGFMYQSVVLQSFPFKDVQPAFHAGVPVLLENWLFLAWYYGPGPVIAPVVSVPDTYYIQNGIGHVGVADNVAGAGLQAFDMGWNALEHGLNR